MTVPREEGGVLGTGCLLIASGGEKMSLKRSSREELQDETVLHVARRCNRQLSCIMSFQGKKMRKIWKNQCAGRELLLPMDVVTYGCRAVYHW